MEKKGKYLLNISTGKIHDGVDTCKFGIKIVEENKRWSDSYEELENFYEGKKKGVPCGICLKNRINNK